MFGGGGGGKLHKVVNKKGVDLEKIQYFNFYEGEVFYVITLKMFLIPKKVIEDALD